MTKSILELNLELAIALTYTYAFVWTFMAVTTSFVVFIVLLNVETLASIPSRFRRTIFSVYLVLCTLNVPLGLFFSNFFLLLGKNAAGQTNALESLHPYFRYGSLAAQTGVTSQILFALLFGVAWLAVESRAAKQSKI